MDNHVLLNKVDNLVLEQQQTVRSSAWIDFFWLVGSSLLVCLVGSFVWSLPPVGFVGLVALVAC